MVRLVFWINLKNLNFRITKSYRQHRDTRSLTFALIFRGGNFGLVLTPPSLPHPNPQLNVEPTTQKKGKPGGWFSHQPCVVALFVRSWCMSMVDEFSTGRGTTTETPAPMKVRGTGTSPWLKINIIKLRTPMWLVGGRGGGEDKGGRWGNPAKRTLARTILGASICVVFLWPNRMDGMLFVCGERKLQWNWLCVNLANLAKTVFPSFLEVGSYFGIRVWFRV